MLFSKPVFDLHSFNAHIVGTGEGGRAWYLQPEPWNTVGGLMGGCMYDGACSLRTRHFRPRIRGMQMMC